MTDLLVTAMACDLTRVGTMQWSDSEAKFMLGFLQDSSGEPLRDHHHGYQHDRGFQPEAFEIIYEFYCVTLASGFGSLPSRCGQVEDQPLLATIFTTTTPWEGTSAENEPVNSPRS